MPEPTLNQNGKKNKIGNQPLINREHKFTIKHQPKPKPKVGRPKSARRGRKTRRSRR